MDGLSRLWLAEMFAVVFFCCVQGVCALRRGMLGARGAEVIVILHCIAPFVLCRMTLDFFFSFFFRCVGAPSPLGFLLGISSSGSRVSWEASETVLLVCLLSLGVYFLLWWRFMSWVGKEFCGEKAVIFVVVLNVCRWASLIMWFVPFRSSATR